MNVVRHTATSVHWRLWLTASNPTDATECERGPGAWLIDGELVASSDRTVEKASGFAGLTTAPTQARRVRVDCWVEELLEDTQGTLSERDIGRELYVSHNTILSHTRSIYRKLGASLRKQAVQRAVAQGIL
jgi:LuxR family maltose regulon positive regulatory protein